MSDTEKRGVNVILNGRHDVGKVLSNLYPLLCRGGHTLLMTKASEDVVRNALKAVGYDGGIAFATDGDGWKLDCGIMCLRMKNGGFPSIPSAYNAALSFIESTDAFRFVHFFTDDCKIVSPLYDPLVYEEFMDIFDESFVMDSKLNPGNFAFKRYSPRLIFTSRRYLSQPISFVQFESKEHFIMDLKGKGAPFRFNESVKRLYVPELVYRLHKAGAVRHTSFYPDPVLEQWVVRDAELPSTSDSQSVRGEYISDERYLRDTLGVRIQVESVVDPIINDTISKIRERLEIPSASSAPLTSNGTGGI